MQFYIRLLTSRGVHTRFHIRIINLRRLRLLTSSSPSEKLDLSYCRPVAASNLASQEKDSYFSPDQGFHSKQVIHKWQMQTVFKFLSTVISYVQHKIYIQIPTFWY